MTQTPKQKKYYEQLKAIEQKVFHSNNNSFGNQKGSFEIQMNEIISEDNNLKFPSTADDDFEDENELPSHRNMDTNRPLNKKFTSMISGLDQNLSKDKSFEFKPKLKLSNQSIDDIETKSNSTRKGPITTNFESEMKRL